MVGWRFVLWYFRLLGMEGGYFPPCVTTAKPRLSLGPNPPLTSPDPALLVLNPLEERLEESEPQEEILLGTSDPWTAPANRPGPSPPLRCPAPCLAIRLNFLLKEDSSGPQWGRSDSLAAGRA